MLICRALDRHLLYADRCQYARSSPFKYYIATHMVHIVLALQYVVITGAASTNLLVFAHELSASNAHEGNV